LRVKGCLLAAKTECKPKVGIRTRKKAGNDPHQELNATSKRSQRGEDFGWTRIKRKASGSKVLSSFVL